VLNQQTTTLLSHTGSELPILCGAMYPCSNPELVAAVSQAGGIGILQPISLTYVHGHDFREGIRLMRRLSSNPIGMNALIEKSSKKYHERMMQWVDIALEEGIRFFVTSLGNPSWVVDKVHSVGGFVYHDVTEQRWAAKGLEAGVDGLIAVNNRAGGHAGEKSAETLIRELETCKLPVVCAGGISSANEFHKTLQLGYAGVQMGTRFIASQECSASFAYKQAIVNAHEEDIVLSEKITGVPVSIIRTDYVKRAGTQSGKISRWMLKGNKTKHFMRIIYALKSLWQLKQASMDESGKFEYWQAGKSVANIQQIETVEKIILPYRQILKSE